MKTMLFALLVLGGMAILRAGEPRVQTGMASWYGAESSHTACGERFNPKALTAAHRSLPFGTMVAVKNLATGRTVTVRINDRGPFRKGRLIDISKRAAQELGMIKSGTAKVELAVVE